MQETRRHILEILRDHEQATVDDIVTALEKRRGSITAVTVRHHLTKLQDEGLIAEPQPLQRTTPGRPQYVYSLSQQGLAHLPNNYQALAGNLLGQMRQHLDDTQVNVIIEGVASEMAKKADIHAESVEERLDAVVKYLNEHGYNASWQPHTDGYTLTTKNCPYHTLAKETDHLCEMDMRLMAQMLGVVPRLMSRIADDDDGCTYLIPTQP